jgi:hypothetical protein
MPIIISTVHVGDGDADELFGRHVVKACHVDSVGPPKLRRVSKSEGTHAAVLAKEMVVVPCVEQIFG